MLSATQHQRQRRIIRPIRITETTEMISETREEIRISGTLRTKFRPYRKYRRCNLMSATSKGKKLLVPDMDREMREKSLGRTTTTKGRITRRSIHLNQCWINRASFIRRASRLTIQPETVSGYRRCKRGSGYLHHPHHPPEQIRR